MLPRTDNMMDNLGDNDGGELVEGGQQDRLAREGLQPKLGTTSLLRHGPRRVLAQLCRERRKANDDFLLFSS